MPTDVSGRSSDVSRKITASRERQIREAVSPHGSDFIGDFAWMLTKADLTVIDTERPSQSLTDEQI